MEKPHLIYALPRTKSSAILAASKKEVKYFEPFSYNSIFQKNWSFSNDILGSEYWKRLIDPNRWNLMRDKISGSNAAVKILGFNVEVFTQGHQWYYDALSRETHEVFVVYRDLEEICWSYLIAMRMGFFKKQMEESLLKNETYVITENVFVALELHIKSFLRHLPKKNSKLISWERLPQNDFDKNLVKIQEQNSSNYINLISNFDFCKIRIEELKELYQPIIDKNVLTLPWAE